MSDIDPVTAQLIGATAAGIVREMQEALFRSGYSTIIRESQDASCAILSPGGALAAQHVVLPLHVGAFPACLAGLLARYPRETLEDGEVFIVNHPYEGGSPHAPDMAVIAPVFQDARLIGFTASIAHKSDIGGPVPGSCSGQAREVFNEGLQVPPVRLMQGDRVNREVEALIRSNSRTPDLVMGDIHGQVGCVRVGARRLQALATRHGADVLEAAFARLRAASLARLRSAIRSWPDGEAEASRIVEGDEASRVHVRASKAGEALAFDFSGSSDQARGPINIRPPSVRAACAYALVALTDPAQPINGGVLDVCTVVTRPGSVLDPRFPAPVNTYNATVHAVINALFEALSQLCPHGQRADGSDSRSLLFGLPASAEGRGYVQYEIFAGGTGARSGLDGLNGCHVNQTNGRIAPIEVIETEFPVRVRRFELIPDSGGAGRWRGGLAFRREYEILAPTMRLSVRSGKHEIAAGGLDGGLPGRCGDAVLNPDTPAARRLSARAADVDLVSGDVLRLDTPGGGGLGDPRLRERAALCRDLADGYVTLDTAVAIYGLTPGDCGG